MNTKRLEEGKFLYQGEWSDEYLNAVRPVLKECSWFIPSWVHNVYVFYNDIHRGNHGVAADCETDYKYRRIVINFYGPFFTTPVEERISSAYHELVHGFTSIYSDLVERKLNEILCEPEQKAQLESLLEDLKERNEQVTEDLAQCIIKKLKCITHSDSF